MSWDKEWYKRAWNIQNDRVEAVGGDLKNLGQFNIFDAEGTKYTWHGTHHTLDKYVVVDGKISLTPVGEADSLATAEKIVSGTAIDPKEWGVLENREHVARRAVEESKRRINPDLVAHRRADQQNADAAKRATAKSSGSRKPAKQPAERVVRGKQSGPEKMRDELLGRPQRTKIGVTYTDVVHETSAVIDDLSQQSWGGRMAGRAERFRRKAQDILTGRLTSTLSGDAIDSIDMEFLAGTIKTNSTLNKNQMVYARDLIMGMGDVGQLQDLADAADKNFNIDTGHLPVAERIQRIKDLLLRKVSKDKVTYKKAVLQTKRVVEDGIPETAKAQLTEKMRYDLAKALGTLQGYAGEVDPDAAARAKDIGVFWFNTGRTNQSVPWKHGRLTIDYNRPVNLGDYIDEFDKRGIDRVLKNPWSLSKGEMEILRDAGIEYEYGGAKVGDMVSIRPVRYTKLVSDGANPGVFVPSDTGKRLLFVMKKDQRARREMLRTLSDKVFILDIETNALDSTEDLVRAAQRELADKMIKVQVNLGVDADAKKYLWGLFTADSNENAFKNMLDDTFRNIFTSQGWGRYSKSAVLKALGDADRLEILRKAAVATEIDAYLEGSKYFPRITELSGLVAESADVIPEKAGTPLRTLMSRMFSKVSGYNVTERPIMIGNGVKVVSPEDMADYLDALEHYVSMNYEIYGAHLQQFDTPVIRMEAWVGSQIALKRGDLTLYNRLLRHSGEASGVETTTGVGMRRSIEFSDDIVDGGIAGAIAVRNRSTDIQKTFQMLLPMVDENGNPWIREKAVNNIERMARGEGHKIVFGTKGDGSKTADQIVDDIRRMFGQGSDWELEEIFEHTKNMENLGDLKSALKGADKLDRLKEVEEAYVTLQKLGGVENSGLKHTLLEHTLGYKAHGAGGSLDLLRLAFFTEMESDAEYLRLLKKYGLQDSIRHSAGRDVFDLIFFLKTGVQRFLGTGELSYVTPQVQAGPQGAMPVFEDDAFEAVEDITKKLGTTVNTPIAVSSTLPERQMAVRAAASEDLFVLQGEALNDVQKSKLTLISDEFASFGRKLMNPISGTTVGRDAYLKWGDKWSSLFKVSLEDGVQLANKVARGAGIAAIIGAAAYIVGTSVSKHNDQEDTTWRYSHKTYAPEQLRTMEERIAQAQVGQMAIQSHYRKNYAYNMNNNKHNHLFRGV